MDTKDIKRDRVICKCSLPVRKQATNRVRNSASSSVGVNFMCAVLRVDWHSQMMRSHVDVTLHWGQSGLGPTSPVEVGR